MPSILESAERIDSEDQTTFNLAVWEKALSDRFLAGLPYRIETDRYGQLIMSPPPAPEHGQAQAEIASLLKRFLPEGFVITECPVSTAEGVKAIDVAWISKEKRQTQRGQPCLAQMLEICVEIISSSNTRRELQEKKTLFFLGWANEVWFCQQDGRMRFFLKGEPEKEAASVLCSAFPRKISLE